MKKSSIASRDSHDASANCTHPSLEGTRSLDAMKLSECRQYLLAVAHSELDVRLKSKFGASDVVQDTLLAAQVHRDAFRGSTPQEYLAWLRRILLNQITTLHRQFVGCQKRRLSREVSIDQAKSIDQGSWLTSDVPSPSSHAASRENTRIVSQALSCLPAHYQQVIALRHRDGMQFDQVAEKLGLSNVAARQLWARAIRALQRAVLSGEV